MPVDREEARGVGRHAGDGGPAQRRQRDDTVDLQPLGAGPRTTARADGRRGVGPTNVTPAPSSSVDDIAAASCRRPRAAPLVGDDGELDVVEAQVLGALGVWSASS